MFTNYQYNKSKIYYITSKFIVDGNNYSVLWDITVVLNEFN